MSRVKNTEKRLGVIHSKHLYLSKAKPLIASVGTGRGKGKLNTKKCKGKDSSRIFQSKMPKGLIVKK